MIGGLFTNYNGINRNRIARLNSDGSLDTSFNPGTGADNHVYSMVLQSDGKVLVGGYFTSYNGTGVNRIAKLNTDGSLDATFSSGTGANNPIYKVVLQPEGKILIGGNFTSYNGIIRNRIARLNANGSLDTSFNPGVGPNAPVWILVPQPDGKILVGGEFTTYTGTIRNYIARLNATGSLDTTFNTSTGANNTVWSIVPQLDGKILIGGLFTSYNGTIRNRIARLNANGSLDTSFNTGTGVNSAVWGKIQQLDGKILIWGFFTSYNGTSKNYLARLNPDGSLDTSFNPSPGANNAVWMTAEQPDGKILIAGSFTSYKGISRNRIARLNPDGSLDNSFNTGLGANGVIYRLLLQPDGKILIAGGFSSFNGATTNSIARLNIDGSLDSSFYPFAISFGGGIYSMALQSDDKILIGGDFSSYNGSSPVHYMRLNPNGTVDPSFIQGSGLNSPVYSIGVQSDGKILLGGTFTNYYGRNRFIRLNDNGTIDYSFNASSGANDLIYNSIIQPDGKILIGGYFTSYNGVSRNRIARLNADGSLDNSFDPGSGADNSVEIIRLQSDGKILIGGQFTSFNGISRNRFSRLNLSGDLDTSFNPDPGANQRVFTIALQPDGKILIGGNFTFYNGTSINRIARLNADGSLDTSFNPGTGANNSSVQTIALQPDGKILIGGFFSSYNGTSRNFIARLNADGSLDTSFNPGTGPNDAVRTIELQPDGKILIGGNFTSYNGTSRNYIARLNADGSLDTSFISSSGNWVFTTALQPDGKILIGGFFTSNSGISRSRIARLNADGSLDASFNPGTGANSLVGNIALQPDGKILLAGNFTSYNGTSRNYIARLNADGSLDTSFDPGTGANSTVLTLALQPDGKILIGGFFNYYNGTSRNYTARINADGSLDTSFDPGTGAKSTVWNIALQPDGKILIGGEFTSYNGTSINRIARLNSDGSLDTSFNPGTGANNLIWTIALHPDGKILIGGYFTDYNGVSRGRIARLYGDLVDEKGKNKVAVCHVTPNGKRKTIFVSEEAVNAILKGSPGSFVGSCNITYRLEEEPELITVPWNTPLEVINEKIAAQRENWFDRQKINLSISADSYNPLTSGLYEVKVDLEENEWFMLEEPISIEVLVLDKPQALDISISSDKVAKDVRSGQVIGNLGTIDPADDIHTYSMDAHPDLDILGNQLIWKGTNIPAAQMKVTVFSTDRAGQTISKEIKLSRELKPGEFFLYPNPALNETNVMLDLDQSATVGFQVYDAIGRLVIQDEVYKEGSFTHTLKLDGLAPGMYTVQLKVGNKVMTRRLIKN